MTLKEASPISAMLAAESTCESCHRMRPNCSFSWGELKNRPENLPRLTSRQVLPCRTGLQGWHHWIFVFHHKMAKTKISHTCSLSLGTARKLAWLGNPWGETGMRNLCACLLHLRPFKHLSWASAPEVISWSIAGAEVCLGAKPPASFWHSTEHQHHVFVHSGSPLHSLGFGDTWPSTIQRIQTPAGPLLMYSCPPHGSSNVSGGQHTQKRPTAALSGWVSTSWPQ